MSITLLIGDNDRTLDMYALNLEMYVGCEVLRKSTFAESLDLLKVLPKLDLIITQKDIANEGAVSILDEFLVGANKEIPLIILGNDVKLKSKATCIPLSTDIKPLIKSAASILGVSAQTMLQQVVPDYYPVSINYLTFLANSFCTIFEKVDDGFQILFGNGSVVEQEEISNKKSAGVVNLYVSKEDRLKFVADLTKSIVSQLSDKELDIDLRVKSTEATMNIVIEKVGVNLQGFDEELVGLAASAIDSLATVVDQAPSLKNLLHTLLNNQSSFLYKHSQLTTFLCFHAIDNMEWGTLEQKNKLAFISFFHDIALTRDELASISTEDELEDSAISKEDKDRVNKHALAAANLIKDYPKAPIGADAIIKQHHGSRSGIGFAKHCGDNISPLAIVFIVCEALGHKILSPAEGEEKISDAIETLHYRFTSEKYSNVLRALSSIKNG